MFYPEDAPRGPGKMTRLKSVKKIQGTYLSGMRFKKDNGWTENWIGRTIGIVDRKHSTRSRDISETAKI